MKTVTRLLSLAIVGCSLAAYSPAKADTAYHRVYHTPVAADDPFSIMDKYQNNILTSDEYNNAAMTVPFSTLDADHKGYITRAEFYSYYPRPGNRTDLNQVMPAAGGSDSGVEDQCKFWH